MSGVIFVFFALTWIVATFALVRWAVRRLFQEPHRATFFSAAVVLAFVAGAYSSFAVRGGPPAPSPQAVQAKYASPHDVTGSCQGARLSHAVKGLGNLDGFGELRAGKSEPEANGFVADRAGTIEVGGWVADLPNKTPAQAACLVIDGKLDPHASALYGIARPDVAASFHGDALVPTGFSLTLPVSNLRRGLHRVSVAVVLASGETDAISSGFSVRVP
jgi:hypothetical protein